MKQRLYFFSSTGNSLHAAGRIARGIGAGTPESIVAAGAGGRGIDPDAEAVGLVFPVYLHKAPDLVLDFLARSRVRGGTYVFAVATNNGGPGSCMRGIDAALRRAGGRLAAGFGLRMPGNSIILADMTNPPEERGRRLAESETAMAGIVGAVLSRERNEYGRREGLGSFVQSRLLGLALKAYGTPRHFHASGACVGCGLCARACPNANVIAGEGGPSWGKDCASCLACYHACPCGAIDLDDYTKDRLRYRHPEVRPEELLYR
jgi:ferredoxin